MRRSANCKSAIRAGFGDSAAVLLLSLVLLNGLITAPLLVECMPADGSSLIELIGQDPCHHPFGTHDHGACPVAAGAEDSSDPCVDLILDNLGITQGGAVLQSPLSLATHAVAANCQDDGDLCQFPGTDIMFRLAREPVITSDSDLHPYTCMRI